MNRYILTGAPGAGKTAIIRLLEARGHAVVEEAATDVIALEQALGNREPHLSPDFIDNIVRLQQSRRERETAGVVQFHDRSAICTYALAVFLGFPISPCLAQEMEWIARERLYEREVFFIENQGFVTPTEARRISFEDSLKFEAVHEAVYRDFGYDCIRIGPEPLPERTARLERHALSAS